MPDGIYVSNYNEKVKNGMKIKKKVSVFDTTLRDGEQTPGVSFTESEKSSIVNQLDDLGVDYIEAGFPANGPAEKRSVRRIARMGLDSGVCGLARVIHSDIDHALDCELDMIHTFVSTSDIHMKYQMNKKPDEIFKMAVSAVEKIKAQGMYCMFSPMDATRSDLPFLKKVCKAVEEAGADIINIPDTVGVMTPAAMRYLISELRGDIRVKIDTHCHNDFGLAVANTIAAVEAGADQVQVTVNGLGERAGNADIAEVVASLYSLYGVTTNIDMTKLATTSKLIERYSMVNIPPNYPLMGKNAFTHESGIHAHAVIRDGSTFEPIRPEMVGQHSRLVLGKHTGRHSVASVLKTMGFNLSPKEAEEATKRIKKITDKHKKVIDEEIVAIALDVQNKTASKKNLLIVDEFQVTTGNRIKPHATVKLHFNGKKRETKGKGIGPVDAVAQAIGKAMSAEITVREYNLKAITGGTEALADVIIKVEDSKRNIYTAEDINADIVMASTNALVNCINKALRASQKDMK